MDSIQDDSGTKQTSLSWRDPLLVRWVLAVLLLSSGLWAVMAWGPTAVTARIGTFVTIFMGIFVEAVPFLVAGSVVSGLIEVFVGARMLDRIVPSHPIAGAFVGSLLGFAFPVCECGVVPVTRRLYQKGLPMSVGVAFLLSAPVVNPVVIFSTAAAFGWGWMVLARFLFSVLIAFLVGVIFTNAKADEVLLPASLQQRFSVYDVAQRRTEPTPETQQLQTNQNRFWTALTIAGDDFIDMGRYLVAGAMMAALMQTFVPQSTLLALGSNPVTSVLVMMALAFILSVCSTVDSFIALSFINTFSNGSILAFLVFGPMVDIKSSLMFLGVFRKRIVAYLILLPLLFSLLIAVFINLNVGW